MGGHGACMQTRFLILRKPGCSFGSVSLIFAHVVRFWNVGPALAPCWAHVEPSRASSGSVSAFVFDLGISVSLNFRPRKAFGKKSNKYIQIPRIDAILGLHC